MLKRVQHDKKKYVIPNLFRNLEFANDNKLIAPFFISHLSLLQLLPFLYQKPSNSRPVFVTAEVL